jgi:hypothetical protein
MSSRKSWVLGIAGVAALGLGALAIRELRGGGAAAPRDLAPAPAPDAAVVAPRGSATVKAAPVPPFRQDPTGPGRVMPYRPATYLRYSEGMPATDPAEDDASPILQRLLTVTLPSADQEATIRAAWRTHEEGRRVLRAAARPPSIGDPILDPVALATLDRELSDAVSEVLTPEQYLRLSVELAPPELEPEQPEP